MDDTRSINSMITEYNRTETTNMMDNTGSVDSVFTEYNSLPYRYIANLLSRPYPNPLHHDSKQREKGLYQIKTGDGLGGFGLKQYPKKIKKIVTLTIDTCNNPNVYIHTNKYNILHGVNRPIHDIVHTIKVVFYIKHIVNLFEQFGTPNVKTKLTEAKKNIPYLVRNLERLALHYYVGRMNSITHKTHASTMRFFNWRSSKIYELHCKKYYKLSEQERHRYVNLLINIDEKVPMTIEHIILGLAIELDEIRTNDKQATNFKVSHSIRRYLDKQHYHELYVFNDYVDQVYQLTRDSLHYYNKNHDFFIQDINRLDNYIASQQPTRNARIHYTENLKKLKDPLSERPVLSYVQGPIQYNSTSKFVNEYLIPALFDDEYTYQLIGKDLYYRNSKTSITYHINLLLKLINFEQITITPTLSKGLKICDIDKCVYDSVLSTGIFSEALLKEITSLLERHNHKLTFNQVPVESHLSFWEMISIYIYSGTTFYKEINYFLRTRCFDQISEPYLSLLTTFGLLIALNKQHHLRKETQSFRVDNTLPLSNLHKRKQGLTHELGGFTSTSHDQLHPEIKLDNQSILTVLNSFSGMIISDLQAIPHESEYLILPINNGKGRKIFWHHEGNYISGHMVRSPNFDCSTTLKPGFLFNKMGKHYQKKQAKEYCKKGLKFALNKTEKLFSKSTN